MPLSLPSQKKVARAKTRAAHTKAQRELFAAVHAMATSPPSHGTRDGHDHATGGIRLLADPLSVSGGGGWFLGPVH